MLRTDNLRSYAFWFADRLKGGKIRSHYNNIKSILTNYNDRISVHKRSQYLDDVLNHAIKTTPFYSNIHNAVISNFPVINKNIIRDNFDSFKSGNQLFSSVVSVITSGSTGTPFSLNHDRRKRNRNTADTIFFEELAGFTIGQKLYYFKIWNKINKKNKLSAFTQNIVPYDVRSLSEDAISDIIKTLEKDTSEKNLLAYASVYDIICSHLLKINSDAINCNVKAIIAMSESFSLSAKEMILRFFNVHPVSRYSNVENGIIAQQMPDGSDEFLINDASYLVEVMEMNSDKAAPDGTPGRIVLTDLFNYCMPLIRYDTGDIGILTYKEVMGSLRSVFKSIEGRRMDMIYNTSGSLVSSFIITNNMWKYKEIKQYQFIQTSIRDYIFKLNTNIPFLRSGELTTEFKGYFGADANITLEYVNEIPLLESGKRKKVINTWKNS